MKNLRNIEYFLKEYSIPYSWNNTLYPELTGSFKRFVQRIIGPVCCITIECNVTLWAVEQNEVEN